MSAANRRFSTMRFSPILAAFMVGDSSLHRFASELVKTDTIKNASNSFEAFL